MILGFKPQLVPSIVDGTKLHTIRSGQRWYCGARIHFYEKVRQKGMRKIREDATCRSVQNIKIERGPAGYLPIVRIDGKWLASPLMKQLFAEREGFESWEAFCELFTQLHPLPFEGQLVHWTDVRY